MAEFEYVMLQANRMCNTQTMCSKECPAYAYGDCCVSVGHGIGNGINYANVAKVVIDWAKAHPEPVYPSWEEGWRQLFPDALTAICPLVYVTGALSDKYFAICKSCVICDDCKQKPIPEEIAKKLGIKPNEVILG